MGHSVGDAADRATKKSQPKSEKKVRTEEQIFADIEKNLDASLSVPPLDIRLLLTRFKEIQAILNRAIDPVIEQVAKELTTSVEKITTEVPSGNQEESTPGA